MLDEPLPDPVGRLPAGRNAILQPASTSSGHLAGESAADTSPSSSSSLAPMQLDAAVEPQSSTSSSLGPSPSSSATCTSSLSNSTSACASSSLWLFRHEGLYLEDNGRPFILEIFAGSGRLTSALRWVGFDAWGRGPQGRAPPDGNARHDHVGLDPGGRPTPTPSPSGAPAPGVGSLRPTLRDLLPGKGYPTWTPAPSKC